MFHQDQRKRDRSIIVAGDYSTDKSVPILLIVTQFPCWSSYFLIYRIDNNPFVFLLLFWMHVFCCIVYQRTYVIFQLLFIIEEIKLKLKNERIPKSPSRCEAKNTSDPTVCCFRLGRHRISYRNFRRLQSWRSFGYETSTLSWVLGSISTSYSLARLDHVVVFVVLLDSILAYLVEMWDLDYQTLNVCYFLDFGALVDRLLLFTWLWLLKTCNFDVNPVG